MRDIRIIWEIQSPSKDLLQNSGNHLSTTTIVAYMQNMESNNTRKEYQHDSFKHELKRLVIILGIAGSHDLETSIQLANIEDSVWVKRFSQEPFKNTQTALAVISSSPQTNLSSFHLERWEISPQVHVTEQYNFMKSDWRCIPWSKPKELPGQNPSMLKPPLGLTTPGSLLLFTQTHTHSDLCC